MNEKFNRYVSYFMSNEWQHEPWQPEGKKIFPKIILIADNWYNLPIHSGVQFFQFQDIKQFLTLTSKTEGIRVNIG
ncbi:hypothetical protein ACFY5J_16780 [Peribacillus butanolivorans]|uniref:hypothetical protein n=2 Tax=Peribacillus butanolivorans TaxID=421767 RepID=UPI00369D544B